MLVKVTVLAILAVVNCQEHQTYSINTVITHDEPRKEDSRPLFEPLSQIVPIQEVPAVKPADVVTNGPQHAKYNFNDLNNYFIRPQPAPKDPAPVYENVIDVTSPATPRRVIQQIPIQRFPVQQIQQTQHSTSQVQQTAVHHSPEIQVQVPHIDLTPVHIPIQPVEIHNIPVHHDHENQQILHHEESYGSLGESQGHNEGSRDDHYDDYYAIPKYSFEYKVEDPHTLDNKYQHETRDGDVVKGVYSLHEPNGSIRTVEYSSDKKTGFNAYVKNTEVTKHIQSHHH